MVASVNEIGSTKEDMSIPWQTLDIQDEGKGIIQMHSLRIL